MHIANFTPDTVPYVHVGLHGEIKPNQIIEVDNQKGNHILNKWGARGLLQLQYGDNENLEALRAKAKEVYTSFWMSNIMTFNQHNERLKNENKAFVSATKELRTKAEEFGVELIGPGKLTLPAASKEIEAAKEETTSLRSEVGRLQDTVNKLVEAMTSQATPERPEIEEDPLAGYIKQFQSRGKAQLKVWARLNKDNITVWPTEALSELQIKWVGTYGENPGKEDEKYPF